MDKLQKWATRIALALALFIPVFFIAAPLGYKFDIWGLMTSFGMLTKIGPKLLMGTAALAALALAISAGMNRKKGIVLAAVALVIPLAGLVHAKSLKDGNEGIPPIHDISTDTQDPPTFTSVILDARGEKSNPVNYLGKTYGKDKKLVTVAQVKAYPEVRTIISADTLEIAFKKAISAATAMGWELQSQSEATGLIEATDTTFWFGFKDDIVIRVRAAESSGSLIDVRSVSRIGRSDIGANAARIQKFSDKFNN